MKKLAKLKKIKIQEYFEEIILAVCFVLVIVVAFEAGMLIYRNKLQPQTQTQTNDDMQRQLQSEIVRLQDLISQKEKELAGLEIENDDFAEKQQDLLDSIQSLRQELADVSGEDEKSYPFIVPSSGILGSIHGIYDGEIYGTHHLGVDIWTSTANGGQQPDHKGNEVVAACDGKVVTIRPENGAITIDCDEIPAEYDVPEHNVYTYYGHMAHAETKEEYRVVEKGQRVTKGQLIGYQGDLSSFFPQTRNVHLHFSVFTGKGETDPDGGAINPCLYIGGECQQEGSVFVQGK